MFLLYHSEGCNICEIELHECYINDLHTTTCSGMLGHHMHPDATVLGAQKASTRGGLDLRGSYNGEGEGIQSPMNISSFPRVGFDLESDLGHFWVRSRVSVPASLSAGDSFGWWRGKVDGDPRSFAQVVAATSSTSSPTSPLVAMGDRGGGRFMSGRGGAGRGRFDGGRGNV
jgi:hypothetical protein